MAHAQKPDFVFRRNERVHLNRRGRQFSPLLAAEVCALAFIVGSNAEYTMFRGSVKETGYPFHSPFPLHFPSLRNRVPSHFNWNLLQRKSGSKQRPTKVPSDQMLLIPTRGFRVRPFNQSPA